MRRLRVGPKLLVRGLSGAGMALFVVLTACEGGVEVVDTPLSVASVAMNPGQLTLPVGQTVQVTATPRSASGHALTARSVIWSSDNPAVATVSSQGGSATVAAVALGQATIRASAEGVLGEAEIAVNVSWGGISAGSTFSCGIGTDGTAFCWGLGPLGNGGAVDSTHTPIQVKGGHTFVSIHLGLYHACAGTWEGGTYCWGPGHLTGTGVIGIILDTPTLVAGGHVFTSVDGNESFACGLTSAGEVYCWGFLPGGGFTVEPWLFDESRTYRSISVGREHACAIAGAPDGEVWCWGRGSEGQLGNGGYNDASLPTKVQGGLEFAGVAAGAEHTCGVTAEDRVYCWGRGSEGQLGNGSTDQHTTPQQALTDLDMYEVSAGEYHTCALRRGSHADLRSPQAYCWGAGSSGQLGTGSFSQANTPEIVLGGHFFVGISAGGGHTCAITRPWAFGLPRPEASLAAYCWGRGSLGALGDGSEIDSNRPVRVAEPSPP